MAHCNKYSQADLQYRRQDSTQTLSEGLAEYYLANPGFENGDFLGQPRETVMAHDVCHVVFGCGSTGADELIVETWTVFGCFIAPRQYVHMAQSGIVGEITRTFGVWRLLRRFVVTAPRVLRALVATRRLKKKWPHFEYQKFLTTPLGQLRRDFGIRVV